MGLFSFLKKAGAGLLDSKPKTTSDPHKEDNLRKHKILLLAGVAKSLGFEVNNLSVDLQDDTVTVYGEVESQADKEKIVLALGNVNGIAAVDDRLTVIKPEPEAVFYEVKKGDSLSKIAKAHYGDWRKYTDIFEANKPMLKDPDKIYPGQVLRLPPLEG